MKVTVTYTAVSAPSADTAQQICRTFAPVNAACDNAAFNGTYYDTNVDGFGQGTTLAQFFANSIAHPGLIAALKQALTSASHSYVFHTTDEQLLIYIDEFKAGVADQGFSFTVEEEEEEE